MTLNIQKDLSVEENHSQHPGGKVFIDNMKAERKDFTEYFKALHSEKAQKILKSFPIVSQSNPSPDSEIYAKIHDKVKHLYKPRWGIQISLILFVSFLFVTGCLTSIRLLSIACFALSQMIAGWMGHSMTHNRDPLLRSVGCVITPMLGALSIEWWSPKHNMHHMFTNSLLYDDDIKHVYKVYLFPLLYLKWRFDSLFMSISRRNIMSLFSLAINYGLLVICIKNLAQFIIGELVAGLFAAYVLIGNHEREKRFTSKVQMSFIDHQIQTSRSYKQNNILWLILIGGMQYQAQHHLFPQIPFYNLPAAAPIIKSQLQKINRSIIYGPIY